MVTWFQIINEALTPAQAKSIFQTHGATAEDFASQNALKLARNRLMRATHSDLNSGGDDTAAQLINAAYDTLKVVHDPRSPEPASQGFRQSAQTAKPAPVAKYQQWQWVFNNRDDTVGCIYDSGKDFRTGLTAYQVRPLTGTHAGDISSSNRIPEADLRAATPDEVAVGKAAYRHRFPGAEARHHWIDRH